MSAASIVFLVEVERIGDPLAHDLSELLLLEGSR